MTIKVATLTDHEFTPSSRFRIRQYFSKLESEGFYFRDYYRRYSTETAASIDGNIRIRHSISLILKAILHESANLYYRLIDVINSNESDVVWLSRQLVIGYPTFEYFIKKPIVYDIDDAIYLNGKLSYLQFKISAKQATAVIAGNTFLADEAKKYCSNVNLVPTAVDTQRWFPSKNSSKNQLDSPNEFNIGWSGTSASFKFLLQIESEICEFLNNFSSVKLWIMADRFPSELNKIKSRIIFIKWTPDLEVEFIQSLDVGLMPMNDDLWSRGKCAYKMLLYSACGIPVIVSPIGLNKVILEQSPIGFGPTRKDEWYNSLKILYYDRPMLDKFSENGVKLVNDHYSVNVCSPLIKEILRKVV